MNSWMANLRLPSTILHVVLLAQILSSIYPWLPEIQEVSCPVFIVNQSTYVHLNVNKEEIKLPCLAILIPQWSHGMLCGLSFPYLISWTVYQFVLKMPWRLNEGKFSCAVWWGACVVWVVGLVCVVWVCYVRDCACRCVLSVRVLLCVVC